jgi:hypothetical protein
LALAYGELSDFSDTLVVGTGGQPAFRGVSPATLGATSTAGDGYSTTFLAFPFEAVSSAAAREDVLERFFERCEAALSGIFSDDFESGDSCAWSSTEPPGCS